jgi:hypothetical protein
MLTIDILDKTCIYCNETKNISLFKKGTNGCKKCKNKKELERHHIKKHDPVYKERLRALNEKSKRKHGVKKMNVRKLYTIDEINEITKFCQSCKNERLLKYFSKNIINGLYYCYGPKCQSCFRKDNFVRKKAWELIKNDPIKKENYYKKIAATRQYNKQNNPDKLKRLDKRKYDSVKADPVKYQKQLNSVKLSHKKYNYKHLDKLHENRRRENLYDSYVKYQIVKHKKVLSVKDIPQELVEMKRNQLLLKRKIKNNDNKEEHSN